MANRKTLHNDTANLSICVGNELITHNSYSPDGLLSLPNMIPACSLGIGEGLADDFLKVGVHGGMRAQPAAKEKPRREVRAQVRLGNGASRGPYI